MSKEFKVGDKVSHPIWGNGEVTNIRKGYDYNILVEFGSGLIESFTYDGKQNEDHLVPSLYHGHGTFEIKFTPGPEPVFEWQWKMRRKNDGFLAYSHHYKSEHHLLLEYSDNYWEIVERDESTKREVKP